MRLSTRGRIKIHGSDWSYKDVAGFYCSFSRLLDEDQRVHYLLSSFFFFLLLLSFSLFLSPQGDEVDMQVVGKTIM